jgi:lysophospholipase L1-like esterase
VSGLTRRELTRRDLLALLGVTAVAASCSTTTQGGSAATSGGSVAMIGDSITEGSLAELTAALTAAGVVDPLINGDSGRRIESGRDPLNGAQVLSDLLAIGVEPDVWIIALGTNDAGSYEGEEAYGALVDLMLDQLPADAPLVWIDVYRPDVPDDVGAFNSALRRRLADRGNAVVGSWFEIVSRPDQQLLQPDQVHPNGDGRVAFAALVVESLSRV